MASRLKRYWWNFRGLRDSKNIRFVAVEDMEAIFSDIEKYGLSGSGKRCWYYENQNNILNIYTRFAIHEGSPRDCFRCFVIFEVSEGVYVQTLMDLLPHVYLRQRPLRRHEAHDLIDELMGRLIPLKYLTNEYRN
ncbi:hypothetical protein SAMN04487819_12111 [Actinopolyspora alba]|uniref:Uncharacterized protein n=1 Tax=Actinopolyspora alba TaxID=673379 RepID=A0A1I2CCN8_9ACTN|nr:hypothetical protein SAMN04487819_12111 [Actinopolyspora alba]